MRNFWRGTFFMTAILLGGCVVKAPPPKPVVVTPPPPTPEAHLIGVWENQQRNGNVRKMIFESGGKLTFEGGLVFFNPARWDLDPLRHELHLIFPQTDDEKLQIFKLYIGEGVKALDRPGKQVVYQFTDDTYSLNIAGWEFSKSAQGSINTVPEPQLK
jgi:hypothetical protein